MADPVIERPCSRCGEPRDGSHKTYCKTCMAAYVKENRSRNREAYNAYQREYQRSRPEIQALYQYRAQIKRKYGLTIEDVQRMYAEQAGRCAICYTEIFFRKKNAVDSAVVDHDHNTGRVRKLLCGNCNKALGCFKDDPETLRAAAQYVESFNNLEQES